ncbi:MAG: ribose-5-phosphate isomerase RpiA [Chloroflexota bacterium]
MTDGVEQLKKQAAEAAVALVESGMVVGLGFGSTASYALRRIGEKLAAGELSGILGVPTARAIEQEARELGIEVTSLEDHPQIDLTIDGADEVDPSLDLIKGGGGALLREKIVAQASRREIIVVDESKLSAHLGTRFPLPVEVIPFGWGAEARYLEALGATVTLRLGADGLPFETDQANWILDAEFGPIEDAKSLSSQLDCRAAVAGHGLFLGLATDVIVAGREGIQHIRKPGR